MDKILANFLKGLGITPEFIQEKMQQFFALIEDYNAKMERIEKRQMRLETMLIRLCEKSKLRIDDIYVPIDNDGPVIDHASATDMERKGHG